MKTINKYLLLLAAAVFSFTACENEIEREPSPTVSANVAAFEKSGIEVDINPMKSALEYKVGLVRSSSDAELVVKIEVVEGNEDIIEVPANATFAKGETSAELLLTFPNAQLDSTYNVVLKISNDFQSPYLNGASTLDFTVNIATWENADTQAILQDGLINIFYAAGTPMWYVDYAVKLNSDGSTDYRFYNPYNGMPSGDADQFGIFDGYPYNECSEESCDFDAENDYHMQVHVTADGKATLGLFQLGMDWGNGMFSSVSAEGETGTYDATANMITFPAGTVLTSLADYAGGNFYDGEEDFIIYLDATGYQNDHLSIEDFNAEDIEWEEQETEVNIFESTIFNFTNEEQKLYKAVNPLEDNPKSPYINLYCLKNAYADGGNLAFYWDGGDGTIEIPVPQNTKLSFMHQDLYIVDASGSVETNDVKGTAVTVFNFDIVVASKNGNSVGEFIETYSYSEDPIVFEKSDFIGNFTMAGSDQFGEGDFTFDVEFKEEGDDIILLGVNYCDTIWTEFDEETGVLAIYPQELPGTFTYEGEDFDLELVTTTPDGDVNDELPMLFAFKLNGTIQLLNTSETDGYLVNAIDLGYLDGYYGLSFTPATASPAPRRMPASKIHSSISGGHKALSEPSVDHLSFHGKYRPKLKVK